MIDTISTEDYRVGFERATKAMELAIQMEGFSSKTNFVKRFFLAVADYLIAIPSGFLNQIQTLGNLPQLLGSSYDFSYSPLEAYIAANRATIKGVRRNNLPEYAAILVDKPRGMVATYKEFTMFQQNLKGTLSMDEYLTLFIRTMTDIKRSPSSTISGVHREISRATANVKQSSKLHDKYWSGSPTKDKRRTFGEEFITTSNFFDVVEVAKNNFKYSRNVGSALKKTKVLETLCREIATGIDDTDIGKKDIQLLTSTMDMVANTISFIGQTVTAEIMVEINLIHVLKNMEDIYREQI